MEMRLRYTTTTIQKEPNEYEGVIRIEMGHCIGNNFSFSASNLLSADSRIIVRKGTIVILELNGNLTECAAKQLVEVCDTKELSMMTIFLVAINNGICRIEEELDNEGVFHKYKIMAEKVRDKNVVFQFGSRIEDIIEIHSEDFWNYLCVLCSD